MGIAEWIAIVAVAWVTLSVLLALIIGRVAKFGDQQVSVIRLGKTSKPSIIRRTTTIWRSTVAADGRAIHRQVA